MCAARYNSVWARARACSVIVSMRETTEEGGETENGRRAAIIGKLKKHINTHIHTRTVPEFRLYAARSAFFPLETRAVLHRPRVDDWKVW